VTLDEHTSIEAALSRLASAGAVGAVVSDGGGRVVGSVSHDALRRVPKDERTAPVSTVTARVALDAGQTLEQGMQLLTEAGTDMAPVVDGDGRIALVTYRGIMRAYRAAARASSRPT